MEWDHGPIYAALEESKDSLWQYWMRECDRRNDDPAPDAILLGDSHAKYVDELSKYSTGIGFQVITDDADYFDDPQLDSARGVCDQSKRLIYLNPDQSPNSMVATLAHELTHALGCEPTVWRDDDWSQSNFYRCNASSEIHADASAHLVCASIGLDASPKTIPYIKVWSGRENNGYYESMAGRWASQIATGASLT